MKVYNIMTDVAGGGINFRKSDNIFQLKCMGYGALIVALLAGVIGFGFVYWKQHSFSDALSGLLFGVIAGGLAGGLLAFFGSGIYLMIYRLIQHLKGKHD